jgi:hypothetical protein
MIYAVVGLSRFGYEFEWGIQVSTTLQSRDIRLTTEQAENCSKLLLNLMRDGESEIVGAGMRHPFPEMIDAIQAAERERKKEEEKRHKAVMEYLQAELTALQKQLSDVESNLGGLPKMGEHLGLNRRPGESEDDFRKRIRDEIQVQILAGTLDDPTGEYRQWAETYDEIEDRKSLLSLEAARFGNAAKSQSGTLMRMEQLEDGSILTVRLLDNDDPRVVDHMRSAIRREIQEQIENGTLDDPDGKQQEWARHYDELQDQKQRLDDLAETLSTNAHLTVDESLGRDAFERSNQEISDRKVSGETLEIDENISYEEDEANMADFLFAASAVELDVGGQFNAAAEGQDMNQDLSVEADIAQQHSPKPNTLVV